LYFEFVQFIVAVATPQRPAIVNQPDGSRRTGPLTFCGLRRIYARRDGDRDSWTRSSSSGSQPPPREVGGARGNHRVGRPRRAGFAAFRRRSETFWTSWMDQKPGEVWLRRLGLAGRRAQWSYFPATIRKRPAPWLSNAPLTTRIAAPVTSGFGKLPFLRKQSIANVQGVASLPAHPL